MNLPAQHVVDAIGKGYRKALNKADALMGIDYGSENVPQIKPEYLVTIHIAEEFAKLGDRYVELEASGKLLREAATRQAGLEAMKRAFRKNFDAVKRGPTFKYHRDKILNDIDTNWALRDTTGSELNLDQKRIDIAVRSPNDHNHPDALIEVKLGNLESAIVHDCERMAKVASAFQAAGAFQTRSLYPSVKNQIVCAVTYHHLNKATTAAKLSAKASAVNKLSTITASCKQALCHHGLALPPFYINSGLITASADEQEVGVFEHLNDDDSIELIYQKNRFAFLPAVIVFGNDPGIQSLNF